MHKKRILVLVLVTMLALPTHGSGQADERTIASAQQEIAALIGALEQSACQFQRNGDWHTAQEAARHLQRKYRALQQRAEVISAEQFIAQAATRSSLSGRPYQVQCPGQTVQGSGEWLLKKLQQLRHPAA